MKPDMKQAPGI